MHGSFRTARSECASNDGGRGCHGLPAVEQFQVTWRSRSPQLCDEHEEDSHCRGKKGYMRVGARNEMREVFGYHLSGGRGRRTMGRDRCPWLVPARDRHHNHTLHLKHGSIIARPSCHPATQLLPLFQLISALATHPELLFLIHQPLEG